MEKGKIILYIGLISLFAMGGWAADGDLTDFVNPRIGTGGHGHVFLGANVPFGFVQLGPTQHTRGWDWCSGYHDSDSIIIGFGHLHLSGTGIGELGDIAFLPVAHAQQREARFSHDDELVAPGYYSLHLRQPRMQVELTATQRTGFHRYTPDNDQEVILRLDLRQGIGWDGLVAASIWQESPTAISGFRRSRGWANDQRVFFHARFSKPIKLVELQGDTVAVIQAGTGPLLVKCALSNVSEEGAKRNMDAELPHWDFEKVRDDARQAWEEQLKKVRLMRAADNTDDQLAVFYTALYHTMVAPSVYCDVDGAYRGSDGKLHKGGHVNYTTFSLWDTYRAAHPLMTVLHPERQPDMAMTMLAIFDQQGKLPVWHLMGNETDCMVGNPAVPVMADLALKGFVDDKQRALKAMVASAMLEERGMAQLKRYGYIPFDKDTTYETVAKGLEYATADHSIALLADNLGKKQDARYFHQRAKSYRHYFDKKTCFMRGIDSNGNFREPFNPFRSIHQHDDYTEGNAWQYTWLVPHDVHGLVALFPSEQQFVHKLDSLFVVEGDLGEEASPDVSGLIGQYAHGNEPSHHVAYLYNYVGQPWKTAGLVRRIMDEMYRNDLDGLSGNEDVGQMSAWYVLSALGLYQVEPAGGKYVIGSPLFAKAEVSVGGGKHFTIVAHNQSRKNIYVQKATLNGAPLTRSYISYEDIANGATLELTMGPEPSSWATQKKDRP